MRYAEFRSFPVSDAVKITYLQWLANDYTLHIVDMFGQDVMKMTTRDWIHLFLLPVALLLIPIAAWCERKSAIKYHLNDGKGRWTSYTRFELYWRRIDDFASSPSRTKGY